MREGSFQTTCTDTRVPTPKRHIRVERGVYKRVTADGIKYEFCFPDENGKTRWSTTRTLKEARDGRAAKIAAVARGERAVAPTKLTFGEFAESWFETKKTKLAPRTARAYRSSLDLVLIPRFGKWKLGAIDADAIAKLTRDLEREGLHAIDPARPVRPLGRSSCDNYLKPLCGVLGHAVRRAKIAANPFSVLTVDDRAAEGEHEPAHEWCDADVDALLAASAKLAANAESRYDYTPLLRVTARLGLRLGEATGLQWRDFDKEGGCLTVARQWTREDGYVQPKTRAGTRRIPLPADLRDDLIALRLQSGYSLDEHPIFASREGGPLQHRNVTRRGFERARDEAKLPKQLSFHDLRHAAASRMIAAGLSPVVVAEILGHEDATVTLKVYSHLYDRQRTDDAVRVALARIGAGA